jgi:hypothetical protein
MAPRSAPYRRLRLGDEARVGLSCGPKRLFVLGNRACLVSTAMANGSEILHPHGGRRLTVPGVGLVEIVQHEDGRRDVVTLEPLSPSSGQGAIHPWRPEK